MKARWVPHALLFSLSAGCHASEQQSTSSAAPSAVTSAAPPASVTASATATPETYAVENLLDLKRTDISRFAYAQETNMLFATFSDPAKMENEPERESHENELEQWDLGAGRMVFRYVLPHPWIVDELFPSPDGLLLGARLFLTGGGSGCRVRVFDTTTHKEIVDRPCIEPNRWSTVRFTNAGDFVVSNSSRSYVAPEGAIAGFDRRGQPRQVEAKSLEPDNRCNGCDVVQNEQGRTDGGLYFTGKDGKRHLVAANHWHDNFALTNDGALLVTTTWDGEVIGWSTADSRRLFTLKWTDAYGYLAYDRKRDRFLLGDAVHDGTSFLRVLVIKK